MIHLKETRRAVNQLKIGKAPGWCGIYAEMLKAERAAVILWLHTLLCFIWNTGIIPTDWIRAFSFRSGMTTRSVTTTRGVTLLSVGKVLARISLDRIRQKLLTHQRHDQSDFTSNKWLRDNGSRASGDGMNVKYICE